LTPRAGRLNPKRVAEKRKGRTARRKRTMKLVRWDPFQDLMQINNQLSRTLGRTFSNASEESLGMWAPPVDVYEKGDQLVFKAELPGVRREDLDVRVEDGVLTLQGERREDTEVKEESLYRRERTYGTFTRSFTLPKHVDGSKITATYKDGILEVTVPKSEAAKPKKVEIQAA
jgi:HSP20 family protein